LRGKKKCTFTMVMTCGKIERYAARAIMKMIVAYILGFNIPADSISKGTAFT
jgi:hypothetical protein